MDFTPIGPPEVTLLEETYTTEYYPLDPCSALHITLADEDKNVLARNAYQIIKQVKEMYPHPNYFHNPVSRRVFYGSEYTLQPGVEISRCIKDAFPNTPDKQNKKFTTKTYERYDVDGYAYTLTSKATDYSVTLSRSKTFYMHDITDSYFTLDAISNQLKSRLTDKLLTNYKTDTLFMITKKDRTKKYMTIYIAHPDFWDKGTSPKKRT